MVPLSKRTAAAKKAAAAACRDRPWAQNAGVKVQRSRSPPKDKNASGSDGAVDAHDAYAEAPLSDVHTTTRHLPRTSAKHFER